jgi:putative transposase
MCGAKLRLQSAYRLVFRRCNVLTGAVDERRKELVPEVVSEHGAWLSELAMMPDQVHLLLEVNPQFGAHRLVKTIKGRTSQALRSEFPHPRSRIPALWTNSYFVATVGGAPLAVGKKYVEGQRKR